MISGTNPHGLREPSELKWPKSRKPLHRRRERDHLKHPPPHLQNTGLQVKELKQNQPDCRCYIVLTKCDLLEQPQPSADPGVSERGEAAPQEAESKQSKPREGGGAELEGVRGEEGSRRGGSGRSPPPGEGLVSVKSRQPGLSPTSPFEREYSGDALDASESGEGIAVHNSPNGTPRIQSVTSMAPLIISLFFLCFL